MKISRLEPAAALAAQAVWQAGEPVPVTVSFDVPAYGPLDALVTSRSLHLRVFDFFCLRGGPGKRALPNRLHFFAEGEVGERLER